MGFLNPDNRSKLDAKLEKFGSQATRADRSVRGVFLTGSLAVLSLILIGAAGWFALTYDPPGPSVLPGLSNERVATAPSSDPVEEVPPATALEDGPGTLLALDTAPAQPSPQEDTPEDARLALLHHTDGPLEVLTLEEVQQLTGVTPDRSVPPAATVKTEPEIVVTAAPQRQPAETAPLEEDTPTPEMTQIVAAPAPPLPSATFAEPADEFVQIAATQDVTPEASEPVVADCTEEIRKIADISTIYFGTGSAQLDANGLNLLRTIGSAVADCPGIMVQVTGHSDSTGDDATNLSLSWQRADNAISALSALGIDTSRFEPVGFGARAPYSQGDNSNPELDRRIEFTVRQAN